jgi:hypothetical protein
VGVELPTIARLFDHLVGGGQQRFGDGKAEGLGGLVVENGMIKVVTPIDEMPAAKAGNYDQKLDDEQVASQLC